MYILGKLEEKPQEEKVRYLPLYQKLFPDFTLERMDDVHYCYYEWYDGAEAPYMY